MDTRFVANLFFEQVKNLTLKNSESFDYQYTGEWVNNTRAGGRAVW